MRRSRTCFTLLILLGQVLIASAARAADYLPGEVLVRLYSAATLSSLNQKYDTYLLEQLPGQPVFRLGIRAGVDPDALCALLRLDSLVVWAEPNLVTLTPEIDGDQWTSTFDESSGQPSADTSSYRQQPAMNQSNFRTSARRSGGAGVTVAVVDTGISPEPRSLNDLIVSGWNALDNNSRAEDAPNFRDDNGNGRVDEQTGHGTMVAGIVALIAGKARLMPVKVLNSDGTGDLWNLAEGIRWALDHGASVLNLSLGMARRSLLLEETLNDAYRRGAVVVTSAGNSNTSRPQYPAGVPFVLTVAALNPDNTKASFSNFGSMIDVCAPGVNIFSTFWNGRFARASGTSFAAPFVTAEVALIRSLAPSASNTQIQDVVRATARSVDDVNPGYRGSLGSGLIDIDRAVARF